MNAYAHTREGFPPSSWEPLYVHLDKVSQSSAGFADAFTARAWGDVLGRCHDLGKLSQAFQDYLREAGLKSADVGAEDDSDTHTTGKRVNHSTFGAGLRKTLSAAYSGKYWHSASQAIIPDFPTRPLMATWADAAPYDTSWTRQSISLRLSTHPR